MTQIKKSTRIRGTIFGDRRTISLRLSIELHERLLAHVDGKSTVNQFLVNLIESGLVYCHSCGIGFLVADTRDWVYRWEGYETIIPSVTGLFCPACGDVFTQGNHTSRLEGLQTAFRKEMIKARQRGL